MEEPLRNPMYIQVSLGVVNNDAQANGVFANAYDNDAQMNYALTPWSNPNFPWSNRKTDSEYATYEENYFRADGTMKFIPEGEYLQYDSEVGVASEDLLGTIKIDFPTAYDLKGITIDFGDIYPTKFEINTDDSTYAYTNNSPIFSTTDNLGRTEYLEITPSAMIGGNQRLRINHILMGVGLNYSNTEVQSMSYSEKNSPISVEIPNTDFNLTIVDPNEIYDVDKVDSFINYLQTGQTMSMSMGLQLDNGEVEYIPMCKLLLSTWSAKKGVMTFNCVDRFVLMDDYYEDGYGIGAKTLYTAAQQVLTHIGLSPDEYVIDECLRDVTIHSPLPRIACREILQLIANAGRCVLCQDREGRVVFKANFGNVIDPEDVTITSTTQAAWSKCQNIMRGAKEHYAAFSKRDFKADGTMRFVPPYGGAYLETGFVSSAVCNNKGVFDPTPSFTIKLQAGFTYYGFTIVFNDSPPNKMQIDTYYMGNHVQTVEKKGCTQITKVADTFNTFDEMVISFPQGNLYGYSRVTVDKFTFGELTDYELTFNNIIGDVTGFRETKVKDILVKVYSYVNDKNDEPHEVDDNVYVTHSVNASGQNITISNPLIDSQALAEQVAEWVAFYYSNNVSYTFDYRGDPRLNANDLVYLESRALNNLQAEIESHKLSFDGTLKGSLELRRAIKQTAD